MSEDHSHSEPKITKLEESEQEPTAGGDSQVQVAEERGNHCMMTSTASKQPCSAKSHVVNEANGKTDEDGFCFSNISTTNLEDLRKLNEQFIKDRNWHQFHSPRNVLLAMVGEVGELAEIFQWKGEVSEGLPELSQAERDHVGQEVSDILIYLIDFACRCRIDLPKAVANKMAANGRKYPVDKAYGRANKYTDYQ